MRKAKNELLQFLGGLAMLVVGLYILSQKVMVYTSFFGYRMMVGRFSLSGGMIMIPFIIGIVWMFASGGSFLSKVFTGLGVLLIIVSIILSINIALSHMTLYEWMLILVLIFGGVGLLARILLANPEGKDKDLKLYDDNSNRKYSAGANEIEKEIERIKRENHR